jgi:hypothetical protein
MNAASPCIGVCRLAEDQPVCIGCHRTLAEIAAWLRLTDTEKIHVLIAVRARQALQEQEAKIATLPSP